MKLKSILLLLLLWALSPAFAARVDSIMVYSPSMEKGVECRVVLPDSYDGVSKLPTIYLLHGYGGNAKAWVEKFNTEALADKYSVIIVAPDGGFSSWYWDSPLDSSMRYETFVAKELIDHIDSIYSTVASREARAITGFSMGGHGALYLSIRHQDIFGAVGSMSGGVDFRPFPTKWHIAKRLGSKAEYPQNWDDYTVMAQLGLLRAGELAIIFDCGVDDFFFEVNNALHRELAERKIPHTYIVNPGAHTLPYWRKSLQHQFQFFANFFTLR